MKNIFNTCCTWAFAVAVVLTSVGIFAFLMELFK